MASKVRSSISFGQPQDLPHQGKGHGLTLGSWVGQGPRVWANCIVWQPRGIYCYAFWDGSPRLTPVRICVYKSLHKTDTLIQPLCQGYELGCLLDL